jgi:hypothetical protein
MVFRVSFLCIHSTAPLIKPPSPGTTVRSRAARCNLGIFFRQSQRLVLLLVEEEAELQEDGCKERKTGMGAPLSQRSPGQECVVG